MMTQDRPARAAVPWTRERVEQLLMSSRSFIERAIVALYNQQSSAQKDTLDTDAKRDRLGFNRLDKPYLNDMAEHILASSAPDGHRLSDSQLYHSLIKLRKYAQQLADLANRNVRLEAERAAMRSAVAQAKCETCGGEGRVTSVFAGETFIEPCPECGNTPIVAK